VVKALSRAPGGAVAGGFDLTKARRAVLRNGLVVVLFESRRLPLFEAHVALREMNLYQPDDKLGVSTLMGQMLDEGTTRRTGPEIAETIEGVGGTLNVSAGAVRTLAPDRKMALELLLECLTQPAFPEDAFKRAKARVLADLEDSLTLPETRASRAYRAAVYGKHPLGRPAGGTLKTVGSLTRDDCIAFHKKLFVPSNAIVVLVGDFDAKEMLTDVTRLTAGWKKGELPALKLPEVSKPEKFTQKIITMPQAAQVQVYLGHVGIRRKDPDYYKLLVMDHILGTGSGFTDRLSARLRDREGLAYTVTGSITSSAGIEPGAFTSYIGTDKTHFLRAKQLFLEELNRIRDTKPAPRELEDVKAYLIGSRLLQFATTSGIAMQLLGIERYGLGFGYLDNFQKAVSAVSAEDVQAVAKKHLHPTRMVLVAAGAIDAKGQPVGEKEKK
jgi:zinc protease